MIRYDSGASRSSLLLAQLGCVQVQLGRELPESSVHDGAEGISTELYLRLAQPPRLSHDSEDAIREWSDGGGESGHARR